MEIEVDIDWQSCGLHIIIDSLVNVAEKNWNMKLTVHDLALKGRMQFVLRLTKKAMPGLQGVAVPIVYVM